MIHPVVHLVLLLPLLSPMSGNHAAPRFEELGRFDRQVDGVGACRAVAWGDAEDGDSAPVLLVDREGELRGGPDGRPSALRDIARLPGGRLVVGGDRGVNHFDPKEPNSGWTLLTDVPARAVGIGGDPTRVVAIGATGTEADGTIFAFDPDRRAELWRRDRAYPGASGLVVLEDGSTWIADTDRHRLVKLGPGGSEVATVGDRGAFPGLFNTPVDLAVHGGRLYVADRLNHRVAVHHADDGGFVSQWGMHAVVPREGEGRIHYPEGIAVSADGGEIVILEPFERRFQVFGRLAEGEDASGTGLPQRRGVESHFGTDIDAAGGFLAMWEPESGSVVVFDTRYDIPIHVTTFSFGGAPPSGTGRLVSIAVDGERDEVWLLDAGHRRIARWMLRTERPGELVIDPFMGRFARGWTYELLARRIAEHRGDAGIPWVEPVDLLVRGDRVHLLDLAGPSLVVADPAMQVEEVIELPADSRPRQFSVLPGGKGWLVVEDGLRGWRVVRPDGSSTVVEVDHEELLAPQGVVAIDGRVALIDRASDRMLVFEPDGQPFASAGETGAWDGALFRPAGATRLPNGVVAIVDQGNHRAQGFDPTSGAWRVSFSLGQGHDRPRLLEQDFRSSDEEVSTEDGNQPEVSP
ncbi:MAG: hypothetical protein VX672_08415 [Planctomycetota bacterium]|nr:hypothetical protein [Planctomycetota bacterium]